MVKGKTEMLSAKKFAKRAGLSYPTVIGRLRQGLIPGAVLVEDSPHGAYWQIPATSVDKVAKLKPGPKPGKKSKKGSGK
jgi:hypothetical protein